MRKFDFQKIFYSNSPLSIDWFNLGEIGLMYEEGLIGLNELSVASNAEFLEAIDFVQIPTHGFSFGGESIQHSALKYLTQRFLMKKYGLVARDVSIERPFIGFEVDVIDKNLKFPCECGDTNAAKLEKYLCHASVEKFYIFPYPHNKDLRAYEFFTKERFFEYIEFKQSYLNKQRAKFVK